jgi:hypothetical protein
MKFKDLKETHDFKSSGIVIYYDKNGNLIPDAKLEKLQAKEVLNAVPIKALMVHLDVEI